MSPRMIAIALAILLSSAGLAAQQTKIKKVPAQYTSPSSGEEMYVAYCASCHGKTAKGNGPAAPALKKAPTDLTALTAGSGENKFPELHVQQAIRGDATYPAHGSKEMPVWGPIFSSLGTGNGAAVKQRVFTLTKYIEALQGK